MYANDPEMAREWEAHTPKGAKLPEKVKHAFLLGTVDALEHFGLRTASEELRLKLPTRSFHGLDAANKNVSKKAAAPGQPDPHAHDGGSSDDLAEMIKGLDNPINPHTQMATRDPLDRTTAWGAPSNMSAGDTANRMSDMGQPTGFGGV